MKSKNIMLGIVLLSSLLGEAFAQENSRYSYPPVADVEKQVMKERGTLFPVGIPNSANESYFSGVSFLAPISSDKSVHIFNVTFAPGVINNWHIHHNSCQVLMGVSGTGYYQIWGEEPKKIEPGQSVTIPEGTKHWHGAAPDHWFQHLAYMHSGENISTQWLEPVSQDELNKLK